jgi:hypothetical protein
MRVTFEPLPSPFMGEGSGGGEDRTSSPHPHLPPPKGEGVFAYPCQPCRGKGTRSRQVSPSQPLVEDDTGRV